MTEQEYPTGTGGVAEVEELYDRADRADRDEPAPPRIRIKMGQSVKGIQTPEWTIEQAGASDYPADKWERDMREMWRRHDMMRDESIKRYPQTEG